MKTCPYCAETIQDAAIICRFCNRDVTVAPSHVEIPPPAPAVQPKDTAVQPEKSSLAWIVVGLLVLFAVLAWFNSPQTTTTNRSSASPNTNQTMNVEVGWNDYALRITNVSTPAGGEMVVYLNGTPPFTYRANSQVPPVGADVDIPLNQFVTKKGERFNPSTHAVTVVWVGGGGFDYKKFGR